MDSHLIAGAELLGGRYCSIQGGIAAQLRPRDAQGHIQTLYQTRYDAARLGPVPDLAKGESPVRLMARGVVVRIWRDGGVLFALTVP